MNDLDLGATIKGFSQGQKIFGRYTLKRLLGRGGMGVVWLARDESLEREVAIKMLPEIVANDPVAVKELKRETAKSQRLSHPRILRTYDFVETGSLCGITMEYVEGGTLAARRLEQPGEVFAPEALAGWVRQLCEALEYAHREVQLVHRDLKPANLMLDRAGDLKVADFGIAASVSDSVSRVSQQAGSSGTPVYMSPQQMMGERPAVTDDVYAMGATLYELLTGKPPFHSGNIILQVQNKVPPGVNARRAELGITAAPVPAAWESVIAACLAKEARDRPQSALEVAEQLGLAARDSRGAIPPPATSPAVAVPVTTPAPVPMPAPKPGKSRAPLFAAVAAVCVLAGAAGYYLAVYAPAREERRAAEQIRTVWEPARAMVLGRIDSMADGSPPALRDEVQGVVDDFLRRAPAAYQTEVASRWPARLAAWEAARQAAARGGIVVRTTPAGAEVQVGAIALERSPLNLRDQRLGKYPVRVRLDGYEEWSGEIEVVENRFAELNVALVRSTGTVTLSTEPSGLDYVLRGEVTRSGRTPANLENLPTGRYEVTFTRPGWPEQKAAVDVVRNRMAVAEAGFLAGGIELNSVPGGAQVWAGGRQIGVTPLVLQEVLPGQYDYELRLAGHQSSAVALKVASRQTVRENIFMQRLPYPQPGEAHENTLGMKFVPVPGIGVLVSIWETRVQDFEAFVNATGHNATEGMFSMQAGSWKQKGDNWRTPGYTQGPAHPVVGINDEDIKAFCRWLTEKERREGRLSANQEYRLPTDAEWEAAAGPDTFPWGNQWPPPAAAGNYNGVEAPGTDWPGNWTPIAGYNDGYPRAAPVGSFPANRHGIYDLGGNVWERIGGRANGMRGAAFNSYDRSNLAVAYRHTDEGSRAFNVGFRIVCVVGTGR